MKILIVDDNEEDRYLLEVLLRGHGYEVESAADGVEALEKASQDGLDMIIADILMPRMDGFQLCRKVKTSEKLKNIAFVFYTATYTDPKDEEFALSLGVEKFIVKPTEPDVFIEILREVIRSYETGTLIAPKPPVEEETVYLKEYNERLVNKLEDKVLQLENANKALGESERKYRELIEIANDAVVVVEPTGYLSFVNPKFCKMTGYSVEEAKKLHFSKLVHPEDLTMVTENFRERLSGEEVPRNYEFQVLTKAGETIYIDYNSSTIEREGKIVGILGIIRDITERKQAEEALRAAEQNFRNSLDNSPLGVRIITTEGKNLYANQAILDIYGYSSIEELKAVPTIQRYTPESYAEHQERKEKRKLGKPVPSNYEISIVRKDGEVRHLEVLRKEVLWDGKTQFQVVYNDITERKRAEEALKRSNEFLNTILDSMNDAISIINVHDFRIVGVNSTFLKQYGVKEEEVIGKTCYQITHHRSDPCTPPDDICPLLGTVTNGKLSVAEHVHYGADGEKMYVEVSTSPVKDENGNIIQVVHVSRDITDRKKMEEQLIVTDRLASVGELASGIAHELNNPLTGVIGFSELLLEKDISDDVKEDIKTICGEAQRAAAVVKGLLTFARKHAPVKQLVNINSIIEKVLELRAYEQRVSNIQVNTNFAPDLPEITADYFQLQQIFLNIIINAEHFMLEAHNRGNLTITTERTGDIIKASFADDGPGISKENLGHVFDPFFTTKEVGKGTGLGLSICHGIITEHGGRIYAESELGKGATFVVELPIK